MSNFSEDCDILTAIAKIPKSLTVMSNFSEDCDSTSSISFNSRWLTVMSNFSEDCDKGISESTISDCGTRKSRRGCNLDDFVIRCNELIINNLGFIDFKRSIEGLKPFGASCFLK